MNLIDLLTLIPSAAWLVPYVLAVSGAAAWLVATIPAPQAEPMATVWRVLNWFGANVRHARNREPAPQPLMPDSATKPPDTGG
jgi:hypothetical protein